MERKILAGKRILVVDHEPEILQIVGEVLSALEVVTVGNLEEARSLIRTESFDLVILDTVGVNGCDLLATCQANKLPAAMLTAREVEVRRLNVATKLGAISFFPKDELHRLPESVVELLERLENGKKFSAKLFSRLWIATKGVARAVWEETNQHPKFPPTSY